MKHIDCQKYAQEILDEVRAVPNKKALAILTVGENPASQSYVKGKIKDCEYCGIPYHHIQIPNDEHAKANLAFHIANSNVDDDIGGIIVQLPLPEGFNEEWFTNMVYPEKDVDGFLADSPFKPCTPEGIMHILRKEIGCLEGQRVLVIGRGKLVGKPLAEMLVDADCTVTIAHSKTKHLKYLLDEPWDVVITATGIPNLVDLRRCRASLVIDAGIARDENGKLVGDCYNFAERLFFGMDVTPVPGGVGLLTRAMLMKHIIQTQEGTNHGNSTGDEESLEGQLRIQW